MNDLIRQGQFGILVSDSSTGECFGVYRDELPESDIRQLLDIGAIIERHPLSDIEKLGNITGKRTPARMLKTVGPFVASYLNFNIPDWVETASGRRYRFLRVCGNKINITAMLPGQILLSPGFIFQRE